MGLLDGMAWEEGNKLFIAKENEDKRKAFYLELRRDLSKIKDAIWNNKVDVIFDNYDYSLYKEKSIEECFISFQVALSKLKNFVSMSGEEIYPKYKHFCHQYKNYVKWLEWYKYIFEEYRNNNFTFSEEQKNNLLSWQPSLPPFLSNEEYLNSHKRRLYQKIPELYPQFEKYNNENDKSNWYCVPMDFNIPKRKTVSILGMGILDKDINYIFVKYE